MFRIVKPPTPLDEIDKSRAVFLAGSIEMGGAEDWQAAVCDSLQSCDMVILNPRRDEWDASWEQTINNPRFREQVEWELDAQTKAAMIAMYFAPSTKAPITLLELGLFARDAKLVVCCPDGFWRRGNVEIVCRRYQIPMVASLQELTHAIRTRVSC